MVTRVKDYRRSRRWFMVMHLAALLVWPLVLTGTGQAQSCLSNVGATFGAGGLSVTVQSDKDLSNVVIAFCGSTEEIKFDGLTGPEFSYLSKNGPLAGVWIKSGCIKSYDGSGYGVFVPNPLCAAAPTPSPTPENHKTVTVCHIPDLTSETWRTVTIKESELAAHLAHGDVQGACPVDCMGVPMGKAALDACGVCGGDGTTCKDCSGVANGGAVIDVCGVCGGNGKSCLGCDGVLNSGKVLDACGICGGDSSTCKDCNGVPGGGGQVDQCGVCGGNNSSCKDCAGTINGSLRLDACGVCGGTSQEPCTEILMCPGILDKCGVCSGSNACLDCAGIPNGGTKIDCCGVCGGDGSTCLDKCKFYDLDAIKKQSSQSFKALYASVRKYSLGQLRCAGRSPSARNRISLAAELLAQNKGLLKGLGSGKMKLCDTPFCSKTSLERPLSTLKRNASRLYALSKEAQYAAGAACGAPKRISTSGGPGGSPSHNAFSGAQTALGKLPDQRCD